MKNETLGNNDYLHEQIINISKAGAFDVVSKYNQELQAENKKLKDRVKFLEDLINEFCEKLK